MTREALAEKHLMREVILQPRNVVCVPIHKSCKKKSWELYQLSHGIVFNSSGGTALEGTSSEAVGSTWL